MNEFIQVASGALGILVILAITARAFRPVRHLVLWLIGESTLFRAKRRPRSSEPDMAGADRQSSVRPSRPIEDPALGSVRINPDHAAPFTGTPALAEPGAATTSTVWTERRTAVLRSPHTPPDADVWGPGVAPSRELTRGSAALAIVPQPAEASRLVVPLLKVGHAGTTQTYNVEEGVLFEPDQFPGLVTALHIKNRAGVLFASVPPGSHAIMLGGMPLGTVALPLRRSDSITNGSWTFSTEEPPGLRLALDSQRPADPLISLEISTRGDCVALTSAELAPEVRALGALCFAPTGPRPADAALQLARSAAIKGGLAGGDWDLSVVGVDQAGILHHAGPLIEQARNGAGTPRVRRGDLITITTRGSGEVTLRVL